MRPLFGRTQYCLGAVVLTLNATGWLFELETLRVRLTVCVNGPVQSRRVQLAASTAQTGAFREMCVREMCVRVYARTSARCNPAAHADCSCRLRTVLTLETQVRRRLELDAHRLNRCARYEVDAGGVERRARQAGKDHSIDDQEHLS